MAQNTITTKGVLIINGKQVKNTFKDLQATTRKLEAELRKLKPGTQEFIDKAEQVKRARAAFENVKAEIRATTQELEKSGKSFSSFFNKTGVLTGLLSFEGLRAGWHTLRGTTDRLLEISDAMTDVQKTSGLAIEKVGELWNEFGNFDTRTKRLDLMKIATEGGRLGITDKDKLQEFTREIDKIYVALGDSFQGGIEEVTNKVGKLKNLFDETKDSDYPEALNEIGSALNELGANGSSSEGNITEFATRVGQLPSTLKPAIDKTLGLGAALEEMGVDAEIGASGYSRFISVAGNNLDDFAKQMKITKEEAQQLFNTKPEEFFLKFAESMKGLSGEQSTNVLKGLKLNTLEIQKTLGAAGDNANRFRELMELSGKAMAEGTSIAEEFNKKNNNAAAIWEKISRGLREFVTDGVVPDFFNWITGIVGKITGVYNEAGNGMKTFRERLSFLIKLLAVATTAMLSYRAAVFLVTTATKDAWKQTLLYNVAMKAQGVLMAAKRGIVLLYAAAKYNLAGNTAKATKAMQLFNVATKMSPLGLFLGVVTAVTSAVFLFSKRQKEATQANKEVIDSINKEVTQLSTLRKMIADNNIPLEKRKELIDKLKEKYPDYLKGIENEGKLTKELADKLDLVNKQLILKARLKANEGLIEEQSAVTGEAQAQMEAKEKQIQEEINKLRDSNSYVANLNLKGKSAIEQYKILRDDAEIKKRQHMLVAIRGAIEEYIEARNIYKTENQKLTDLLNVNADLNSRNKGEENEEEGSTVYYTPPQNSKGEDNKPLKSPKDYSSEYRNAQKARLQAEKELQKEITQGLEESLDKQLAMTEQKYNEKKFKLQQENADLHLDIQKLQEEAKTSKDPNIQKAIEEKRQLIEINKKIEVEFEKQKQAELQEVRDKYHIKEVERTLKEYNDCIDIKKREKAEEILLIEDLETAKDKLRDTLSEKELSQIKTLEDAKKALRKQADKEILQTSLDSFEAQKKLLLEYLRTVSDGEAKDKLLEDLRKLEEQITKVKEGMLVQREEKPSNEAKKVDILGFSAKEWDDVFNHLDETSNRIRAVEMSMGALNNAFSMFSQLQQNLNEKEMHSFSANQDKKKKALLGQLNQGYISQAQYHKELQRLDEETESKKKELAIKQFKAKKAMDMANIITNTAVGVMRAYADGGILAGPLFAAIVAGIGAIQLGLVASQQPPSYARGGRTKGIGFTDDSGHEVAGVVHANEYVIPQWLRKDPEVARVEEWLEAKRTGNRQQTLGNSYSDGGRVAPADNQNYESVNQQLQNVRSATSETMLLSALERLIELLEKLDKEGIDAYIISDAKNGKELQKAIKLYQELKDKNKH
ncbi:phage tail tape measure protein [Capnocytophaga stomatis]|uniref:phage tail tape measure protein n=1 Tax=Capnocytophaga stomatis TaxID=1848904 RepID=UPI00385A1D72